VYRLVFSVLFRATIDVLMTIYFPQKLMEILKLENNPLFDYLQPRLF